MTDGSHMPHWNRDFAESPYIVIWEVTRACQLHCLHCRAEAQRHRNPLELRTEEAKRMMDDIAVMDHPLLVLTGGDPLERDDLFDLIRYGTSVGLSVSMTPSATPKVTREAMVEAKAAGLTRWAFSLDGSTAQIHDKFRGTKGSYELTLRALDFLRELKMPIQLNTTVSRYNVDDLQNIADIAESYGAVLWSVFFLVPTGRAQSKDMVSAEEHERVMEWLYGEASRRSFSIKTTAAPHYRRVVIQQSRKDSENVRRPASGFILGDDPLRSGKGVNDGNGFLFISHTGDICPSGFLPMVAGNIRSDDLAEVYRNSPLFAQLRNPGLLKGKCGVCEFRAICGGSRARAYGMTGDYLESDPSCAYQPRVMGQ